MKSGDVGRCVIVLISDGRANVPLSVSIGEEPEVVVEAGAEKVKLTDAEKKEQRAALKDEVRAPYLHTTVLYFIVLYCTVLYITLSLSLCLPLSLPLFLSHTHTHTHTLYLSFSLSV